MKALLLLTAILCLSCEANCDEHRLQIEKNYLNTLNSAGGNIPAAEEARKQRDVALSNLDC